MTEQKKPNDEVLKKQLQDEVNKQTYAQVEKVLNSVPVVEFSYNKKDGHLSNFHPNVNLKVSGNAEFIKKFSAKLIPFVNEAIEELSIPTIDENQ